MVKLFLKVWQDGSESMPPIRMTQVQSLEPTWKKKKNQLLKGVFSPLHIQHGLHAPFLPSRPKILSQHEQYKDYELMFYVAFHATSSTSHVNTAHHSRPHMYFKGSLATHGWCVVKDYPFLGTFQIELLQGFHPFESPRACSSDIPISV